MTLVEPSTAAQVGEATRRVVERIRIEETDRFGPDPWLTDVIFLATMGRSPTEVLTPLLRQACAPGDIWTLVEAQTPSWFRDSLEVTKRKSLYEAAEAHFNRAATDHRPLLTILCSEGTTYPRIWMRGYFARPTTEARELLGQLVTCVEHPEALVPAVLSGEIASSLTLTALDPSVADRSRAESRAMATARLREAMGLFGLSAQECADVLGVSRESVRKWLNGADIDFQHQARIAELHELLQHALSVIRPESLPTVMRRTASRLGGNSRADLLMRRDFDSLAADFDRLASEDVLVSA